jgi:transcriptional regulator with XRE-family HTH domain
MSDFDPHEHEAAVARARKSALSANQLVAFNLMRLRRHKDWSQQDVAELLEKYTGRSWSNASVSAAERAWQGGRPRRFDASEILALSQIFDEPIASFFLPPAGNYRGTHIGMKEFPDGQPNRDPESPDNDLMALVPVADVVRSALYHDVSPGFEFGMQSLTLEHVGLLWMAPEWRFPLKHPGVDGVLPVAGRPEEEVDDHEVAKSVSAAAVEKMSEREREAIVHVHAVEVARQVVQLLADSGIQLKPSKDLQEEVDLPDPPF